jgi:hypothetical protein
MEADWSVEIGADLPVIAVPWEGFIDLRRAPSLANSLEETATAPALAQALGTLNAATSPVFTSKCDLWLLTPDDIDPLEFGASREQAQQGIACYIDVVARDAGVFASFAAHEAWVRAATAELCAIELPQARLDYVVRASSVDDFEGFAVTLYAAACAVTEADVKSIFHDALETATAITIRQATKRASSSIG